MAATGTFVLGLHSFVASGGVSEDHRYYLNADAYCVVPVMQ